MEIDKTTLHDLSIFHSQDEDYAVLDKINLTRTTGGRDRLHYMFQNPLKSIDAINDVQESLRLIVDNEDKWPLQISNGSVMMIYKYYEEALSVPPARPNAASAYIYKIFHVADYSLIKYSVGHAFGFIKGLHEILDVFLHEKTPAVLKTILQRIQMLLASSALDIVRRREKSAHLPITEVLSLGYYIRFHYKQQLYELIQLYSRLDAYYGMAMSVKKYGLSFPVFKPSAEPILQAEKLYHILLENPVAYDVELNRDNNFIFLTGANMAGKSTFIKAVGSSVFLAHLGMGVPAASMELSLFDGLLSNINVVDNVVKGQSFFYNEVQRIKNTILKVSDGRKWLILIDELFKGTNVQDAMKCSRVVIEGLIRIPHSLFILSTHLYEIGHELKKYPGIDFKYFETNVSAEQLDFSYVLKDGISDDRLGYLILKREKVIELLDAL